MAKSAVKPDEAATADSGDGRHARGDATRTRVLEAVVRLLARNGPGQITHRAVAKEAGVSLSATTYYFRSKSEMLHQAFRMHIDRVHGEVAVLVDRHNWSDDPAAVPLTVREMSAIFEGFLLNQLSPKARLVQMAAVEAELHCARDPELSKALGTHTVADRSLIADLLGRAGSKSPLEDTEILFHFIEGATIDWLSRGADPKVAERASKLAARLFRALVEDGPEPE